MNPYIGIYDFELLPYALGDVLTWNVQSAIKAIKAGRSRVDIHICLDPRYPSSIYQRGLVNEHNHALFFNELLGAFNTHPMLGDITIYHDRDRLLARLDKCSAGDETVAECVNLYKRILAGKADEQTLPPYFISEIYSHEVLNAFAAQNGYLPQLQPSSGCLPDIQALLSKPLAGRRIVVIHPRLRQLDKGYGGEHTFFRDSDMMEWMAFIQKTQKLRPEVQFVVVGRLQEKPLTLLEQPNVMSLRSLGLGLGHELTLLSMADLFIGTSSGFAAMANFCATPYFITKMNPASCVAYAIKEGEKSLPFAHANQELVYENETTELLLGLLERGLNAKVARGGTPPVRYQSLDPKDYEAERARFLGADATTSRYFADELAIDAEVAYLLWPKMRAAFIKMAAGDKQEAHDLANRIAELFPRVHADSELVQTLADPSAKLGLFPFAHRRLTEHLRAFNSTHLPIWLRNPKIISVARKLKSLLVTR